MAETSMRLAAAFKGVLTLLGIAAIGLVAAVLDSPLDFSSEGGGGMSAGRSGPSDAIVLPEIPLTVQVLVLILGVALAGVAILSMIENPMDYITVLVGICAGVALLAVMFAVILGYPASPSAQKPDSESTASAIAQAADGSGGSVEMTTYIIILFGGWFLVFMLFLLYLRSRDSPSDSAPADRPELDGDSPAAIGAAAGRAATQIENASAADLENGIYRAWHEMTALLPVASPRTTTPREFEAAAVEAGLERDEVSALTELFESVRYGTLETTSAREERAVETLRRIESTYSVDEDTEVSS